MRVCLLLIWLSAVPSISSAQKWVDTIFSVTSNFDIAYGEAVDFAGNSRQLLFDVSYPTADTPSSCGRPLIVLVHGGAFMAGSKEDATIVSMRKHFAQRGYVAAAVNYRLGLFQTSQTVNCNVSALGINWNCLNMADTAEWYRAYIRGIQDINGAIRFLINNKNNFQIDPNNVFIAGESAGAFIAMGVGFIDDTSDVLSSLTIGLANAKAPNSIYESACIQSLKLDTSIASMRLMRPDLLSYKGTLNIKAPAYTLRGVGSMYGAVFNNIFETTSGHIPALYMFHQPNDLIVPMNKNLIFNGYVSCLLNFPFNCGYIINRPKVLGSQSIADLIDGLKLSGKAIPDVLFEKTTNAAGCSEQLSNPTTVGHTYDNYFLRTKNMARFFAGYIDSCQKIGGLINFNKINFAVQPNPISKNANLIINGNFSMNSIVRIFNMNGELNLEEKILHSSTSTTIELWKYNFLNGLYLIQIENEGIMERIKVVVMD